MEYQRTELPIQQGPGQVDQPVTIGSLSDDVLLEIFDFYQVIIDEDEYEGPQSWENLVHVCRRWRYIIFESSIRLNLQLFCYEKSPVRKLLDVWPAFPLVIVFTYDYESDEWDDRDPEDIFSNFIAALERCDRVRRIHIYIRDPLGSLWERVVTAMQKPFPMLTYLEFHVLDQVLSLPDTFMNGTAPCLQNLQFEAVSFPSLPRLLSSTSDLTYLHLEHVDPRDIPPETMAERLSSLPKLEDLNIDFGCPATPYPQRRNRASPPPTRFVLPALTSLEYDGVSEYLEVLAARIDAPLLRFFKVSFRDHYCHRQPELASVFDIPQTVRFFGHIDLFRSSSLTLSFNLDDFGAFIFFPSESSCWRIPCPILVCQVHSMAQICNQILSFRSSVTSLTIEIRAYSKSPLEGNRRDVIDFTLWSQLFHTFTSVHSLEIPAFLEPSIVPALQGQGESADEVLPSLHSLSIRGYSFDQKARQAIQSLIAARQHNGRPITVK